jgi:hypothetical protein
MAKILGKDVTLQLRESTSTGAYFDLICETTSSVSGTANVTTTVTKCGTDTAVSTPTYTFSVDGLVETAPTGSQASAEQLLSWFNNNTLLDVIYQDPASGANFHIEGEGYITEFSITAPAEGSVAFTASFQLTGAVDIIP